MRKYFSLLLVILSLVLLPACQDDPLPTVVYDLAQPASLDPTGGTWRTVMNVAPNDVQIDAPQAVTSPAYVAELQEVLRLTQARTVAQTADAEYWGSGGVLRWNQIARELVAKYNVPPAPGSSPNPAKPVASPPWAARAYAMLSVAQYDALVITWHYKYQHQRPAPAKNSVSLVELLPSTDLPSFPSEDAAVAAASFQVLKALFPLEEAYLNDLAQRHQLSRLWAGANVRSDLVAGAEIGEKIAALVLARGRSDRMGTAADPNDTWLNITVPYTPWKSMTPEPTKPLLPLFGEVRTWFDSASVFTFIPPPPPTVGSVAFQADLDQVIAYVKSGKREYWRIADFWADGAGTFTPPGHWNAIAETYIREAKHNELRAARVFALMNRAIMDGGVACWYAKYKYFFPRPIQIDGSIRTATGTPNFPAYTSGHATFSMAAASVLAHLFPEDQSEIIAMAEEAGLSRVVSGIHYQFDNLEGQACGKGVGNLAIEWALTDGAD